MRCQLLLRRASVSAVLGAGLLWAASPSRTEPISSPAAAGCEATTGAPVESTGPTFLTCTVAFPKGTVTGSVGAGITVSDGEYRARVWDNHVDVVLPAGYSNVMRYPVLYLLHGDGDTYRSWESNTDLDA